MTSRPELIFKNRRYTFRSAAVFAFLDTLRHAANRGRDWGWTDLVAMSRALPGQGPRQFARYVDMLADAGLPLVEWETKTRGPWRLAVSPGALSLRRGGTVRASPDAPIPDATHSLAVLSDPAWVEWALLLAQGNMAIHDGAMDEAERALARAEEVAHALPVWAGSIAGARMAHLLLRRARYREASIRLRRLESLCRKGLAARSVARALPLIRAKYHYDRGRLQAAEHALTEMPQVAGNGEADDPHALNMRALIAGRRYWKGRGKAATADLTLALESLLRALGAVLLNGETTMLDALCYNLANNMLRGVARRAPPAHGADTALRWLAMNMFLCRKLGLGGDSILVYLLLMDTWLEHGLSPEQWPSALRDGLNLPQSPKGVLAQALEEARTNNMPLELALCLKRQMLITHAPDMARNAYEEATALLKDIGNVEELRKLRTAWQSRWAEKE